MGKFSTSPATQALLLLTLPLRGKEEAEPLTRKDCSQLMSWLRDKGHELGSLLSPESEGLLQEYKTEESQHSVSHDRINKLLNRGVGQGISVDEWNSRGICAISNNDPGFPRMAGDLDPAQILYCSGDLSLFDVATEGIAIVGFTKKKTADPVEILEKAKANHEANIKNLRSIGMNYYTDLLLSNYKAVGNALLQALHEQLKTVENVRNPHEIGNNCAKQGIMVFACDTGDNDLSAARSCVENGGQSIIVGSSKLLDPSSLSKFRKHINNNNLMIVSPFHPGAKNSKDEIATEVYLLLSSLATSILMCVNTGESAKLKKALKILTNITVPIWVQESTKVALQKKASSTISKELDFDEIKKDPAKLMNSQKDNASETTALPCNDPQGKITSENEKGQSELLSGNDS